MIARFGDCVLELVQGNIVEQRVDAIVNAANSLLAGGGGVDGAIHRAGGAAIMEETRRRYADGCPTGSAVASGAGKLPTKHIIHAVGPVYSGGERGEPALLASAYRTSLQLAAELGCESIAFPALSTGAFDYPMDSAAQIALATVIEYFKSHALPRTVRFVLFDAWALASFKRVLKDLAEVEP